MSRAALWKQQERVRERESRAAALFEEALEQGRHRASKNKSTIVPLWGADDGTFHWNPALLQSTIHNAYFQTCCESLQDWNAIVDEIYNQDLRHVQPRSGVATTSAPSTAFCLLLRLLLYRMTTTQLHATLSHPDSVYIQAIGFLYVRYSCPPDQVLSIVEPYLLDPTEISVEINGGAGIGGGGGNKNQRRDGPMTLGEYVRKLLGSGFGTSRDYYGTPLPRYPTIVERDISVKVLQVDAIHERAIRHWKHPTRVAHDFCVGRQVRALYGDDDHPVEWYDAVIDRVITQDPNTGRAMVHPRFVVTYPEYGNTETVSLGELDVIGGTDSESRGDWRHAVLGRGYDRSDQLYDEVRRRERDSAAASNRSGWAAKRPPTTKAALSSGGEGRYAGPQDDFRRRHKDHDDDDDDDRRRGRPNHHHHHHGHEHRERDRDRDRSSPSDRHDSSRLPNDRDSNRPSEPPRKRSAEELAAVEEKKRRLLSKYG